MKATNIPLFVTIYAIIMAVAGTGLGLMAFFDPSSAVGYVTGADVLGQGWAGRNLGLGLGMAFAIFARSPAVYVAAFIGALCREISDVVGALSSGGSDMLPVLIVFLVLDIVALYFSVKAYRS